MEQEQFKQQTFLQTLQAQIERAQKAGSVEL